MPPTELLRGSRYVIKGSIRVGKAIVGNSEQFQRNVEEMLWKGFRVASDVLHALAHDERPSESWKHRKQDQKESDKKKIDDLLAFPDRNRARFVNVDEQDAEGKKKMREKAVPSTQVGRAMGFGMLGAQLTLGVVGDSISRLVRGDTSPRGISDANAERLAEALCRMRGAALKLGQMLSIQDTGGVLPPALEKALERVRDSADFMPVAQLERQLQSQLGSDWRTYFDEFDMTPIAAASIGQVHRATLPRDRSNVSDECGDDHHHNGERDIVLKVQYPGVADSIDSDLRNLRMLVKTIDVLPKTLYVDEIMRVAGGELKMECDYVAEAAAQRRYRELVASDPVLCSHTYVPAVVDHVSSDQVLASEFVQGFPLDRAVGCDQDTRNAIARTVLFLTMKELFEWRFMQTDPNFRYTTFCTYRPLSHSPPLILTFRPILQQFSV